MLREDQKTLTGNIMNLQNKIGIDWRVKEIDDHVETIWERIIMTKNIVKQVTSNDLQSKEGMEKINSRALSETSFIKADIQTTI